MKSLDIRLKNAEKSLQNRHSGQDCECYHVNWHDANGNFTPSEWGETEIKYGDICKQCGNVIGKKAYVLNFHIEKNPDLK